MRSEPISGPQWATIAVLFVYAAAGACLVQCAPARPSPAVQEAIPEPMTVDELMQTGGTDGGVSNRRGIPAEPIPEQKRPPCDTDAEEYPIAGACWQATPRIPPCGPRQREHEGRCYRPIAKPLKAPISGQ